MRLERILRLPQRRDDRGVSLVELVVAIAVFSIVMTMIFGTVLNVMNASNAFQERTQEQADTRLAIDTLTRELRQAYQTPGTPSVTFPVYANKIIFYSPDRAVDFHLRMITYAVTGTILTRSVATSANGFAAAVAGGLGWGGYGSTASATVLTGITNPGGAVFKYLNQAVPPTTATSFAMLRSVVIDLTIDQTPGTSAAKQTYHTQVDLRVT